MLRNLKWNLKQILSHVSFPNLRRNLVVLNDLAALKQVFGWQSDPILDTPVIHRYDYLEDVNQRRLRDAEAIGTVMRNANPSTALEIGTSEGYTTALMAVNAPASTVHTVNIPPDEIGEGGKFVTYAPGMEQIGKYYKERGLKNVRQILANTKTWKPDLANIDVAFIDGCHDTWFVINDTNKILPHMRPGGFLLWHDFNLGLINRHEWIFTVCLGVEKLYEKGILHGPVFNLKDSWVGIHKLA